MTLEAPAVKTLSDIMGPKFSIITKALSGGTDGDGKRRFRAVASSTISDTDGDEITLPALEKMAEKFRQGVTIFMDHDYKHVDSAYGLTDGAEIVQRSVDGNGAAVWDLDITGVVNTPNPRAVQLADSIDGGFVKLGTSITAFVRKHGRSKAGGMRVDDLDVFEASIVGVPSNQRSWAQKAALAIKSFKFEDTNEEMTVSKTQGLVDEPETEIAETDTGEAAASDESTETTSTAGEAGPETVAVLDGAEAGAPASVEETVAEDAAGVQESEEETPETTPTDEHETADPPEVKAASYSPEDVAALVKQTGIMATEIGWLREKNAELEAQITAQKQQNQAVSTEVDTAKQVIEKVMGLPLRSQTAGYVEDFTKTHSLFAPEVADYLNKRSSLSER